MLYDQFTPDQCVKLLECEYEDVPELAAQYISTNLQGLLSWRDYAPGVNHIWEEIKNFVPSNRQLHEAVCVDWDACGKIDAAGNIIEGGLEAVVGRAVAPWVQRLAGGALRLVPVEYIVGLVVIYITKVGIRKYCQC